MTSNMSSLGLTSSNTRLVDLSYDVLSIVDYREYKGVDLIITKPMHKKNPDKRICKLS